MRGRRDPAEDSSQGCGTTRPPAEAEAWPKGCWCDLCTLGPGPTGAQEKGQKPLEVPSPGCKACWFSYVGQYKQAFKLLSSFWLTVFSFLRLREREAALSLEALVGDPDDHETWKGLRFELLPPPHLADDGNAEAQGGEVISPISHHKLPLKGQPKPRTQPRAL